MPMVPPEQTDARRRWMRAIQSGRTGVHGTTANANRSGDLGDPTLLGRTLIAFAGPDGRIDAEALATRADPSRARTGEVLINAFSKENTVAGDLIPTPNDGSKVSAAPDSNRSFHGSPPVTARVRPPQEARAYVSSPRERAAN